MDTHKERITFEGRRNIKTALEGIVEGELQRESKGLMEYAFNREIPVYVLEPEIHNKEKSKVLMKELIKSLNERFPKNPSHYLNLIKNAFSKKDVDEEFMKKMYGEFNASYGGEALGINRNSIWAKKAKEYIIPNLKKLLGRMPKLGVDIGAAHLGIKYDLLNDEKRNKVIEGIKGESIEGYSDKFSYDNYKTGRVGQVYIAQRKNNHWKVSEESSGLF